VTCIKFYTICDYVKNDSIEKKFNDFFQPILKVSQKNEKKRGMEKRYPLNVRIKFLGEKLTSLKYIV